MISPSITSSFPPSEDTLLHSLHCSSLGHSRNSYLQLLHNKNSKKSKQEVRQHPPSLSVMRGETATLSCHFKVESLKHGVQWFKMQSEKQLIAKSSRQIASEKNQTSSLVITDVAPEDSGWYYCEVNVLHRDPERGNGTELVVLGEKTNGRSQK
uniref:Ig-like domain-containing protein n=1 Tax=Stegastes partitus TaxID=144197 RepID=A0A3B5B026_9TELE